MKMFTRKLLASLAAAVMTVSVMALPVSAADGKWQKDSTGWWYSYSDGTYARNCWQKIGGEWYAFDQHGYMRTGWLKDGGDWYYLTGSGAMASGWVRVGGSWYYMDSSGRMQTGWLTDGTDRYYLTSSGAMATGDVELDGVAYTFDASGRLVQSAESLQLTYELPDGWVPLFEEEGSAMLLREDVFLTGEGSNIMVLSVPLGEMDEVEMSMFKAIFSDPQAYAENEDVQDSMVQQLAEQYDIKASKVTGKVNKDTGGDVAVTFQIDISAVQGLDEIEMTVSQTQVLFEDMMVIVQLSAEKNDFKAYRNDLKTILKTLNLQ